MSCKGAVWSVPTQKVALVHGGDVGEDGEDVLLEHTTRLTFSNTATLRKALEERGGGADSTKAVWATPAHTHREAKMRAAKCMSRLWSLALTEVHVLIKSFIHKLSKGVLSCLTWHC